MAQGSHRVLVLGACGFFGSRIAELLAKTPGLELILAGRDSGKATALAYRLGLRAANARIIDATDPKLAQVLRKLGVQSLIHTVGPFQGQNYQVAHAAIEAGANYLDLADGREFVAGIPALDGPARAAGVCVISGVSSLPALSSAVLDRYAEHFAALEHVAIGISSGARVPGLGTLRGVFSYAGKPFKVLENGRWVDAYGWLDRRTFQFPKPVGPRLLGRCDVPDLEMLPKRFPSVKTVSFHAGFASDTGHRVIEWLASQVRAGRLKSMVPFAKPLHRVARALESMLSDRGGMFVRMTGPDEDGRPRTLTWQLLASENHGPYIPCAPSVALTRKFALGQGPEPGARPCLGMLTVEEILDPLQGLRLREIGSPVPKYDAMERGAR